jgi:RimJ/RimL family protein N-acetyltransferase
MDWKEHFVQLRITTPILELRTANETLLNKLGDVAAERISPAEPGLSPFRSEWDQLSPEGRKEYIISRQNTCWDQLDIPKWRIPLIVCINDEPVGEIIVGAQRFRTQRVFSTASWLAEDVRGQGYGVESRAAALQFGFGALAAERAISISFVENERAIAVSRSLSYKLSGASLFINGKKPVRRLMHYRIESRLWEGRIKRADIEVTGMCTHFP